MFIDDLIAVQDLVRAHSRSGSAPEPNDYALWESPWMQMEMSRPTALDLVSSNVMSRSFLASPMVPMDRLRNGVGYRSSSKN